MERTRVLEAVWQAAGTSSPADLAAAREAVWELDGAAPAAAD
jgi:hypothetical protein